MRRKESRAAFEKSSKNIHCEGPRQGKSQRSSQISWIAANGAAAPRSLCAKTTKDSHLAVETVGVWE